MNCRAEAIFLFLFLKISAFCNSLPLLTNSRWIVDQETGNRVKLTCVNWVSHLNPMVAEGLEKKPVNYIAQQIASNGFNCVRFTWATFMFTRSNYSQLTVSQSLHNLGLKGAKVGIYQHNRQFLNMKVVDAHKAVVNVLGEHRLMVVLDNHISRPDWCCSGNDGNGFFGDANFNPTEWLQGLATVARAYKGASWVVGMSLRNELRGERQNQKDWYNYMQLGAETIHKENPEVLVIVSGLNSDTNLAFLKSEPFGVNLNNKLVYEAHWYSFGIPASRWAAQTNRLCSIVTKSAQDNYLFLTSGNNPTPLFLGEFGIDQRGTNEADNRYISCLLAAVAESDIDWALWAFQGSYMLRQGTVNLEEFYGAMNLNWDGPRNSPFLNRLEFVRQIHQVPKSNSPTFYIMFHPQTGQCVQFDKQVVILGDCKTASPWDQHQEGGTIKLAGSGQCLSVAGDNAAVHLSNDCSSSRSQWRSASASGLHLAARNGGGRFLCLDKGASDSTLVTRACLCLRNSLADEPSCHDNPAVQWFKLVPANV